MLCGKGFTNISDHQTNCSSSQSSDHMNTESRNFISKLEEVLTVSCCRKCGQWVKGEESWKHLMICTVLHLETPCTWFILQQQFILIMFIFIYAYMCVCVLIVAIRIHHLAYPTHYWFSHEAVYLLSDTWTSFNENPSMAED